VTVLSSRREWLRREIDARLRERDGIVNDTRIHGLERTYNTGCRCDECRTTANNARSERRRRQIEQKSFVCKSNKTSYDLGCRCWDCKSARYTYQRNLRRNARQAA